MNFVKRIKGFFTGSAPDAMATASRNLFSAANDAFDAAYASSETHATRANHRYIIWLAARSPDDADAYNEEIAGYTDPSDFKPYTCADLDAHSDAIESLATAFDKLTAAFVTFGRTDRVYKSAAALYKATAKVYVFATEAYSRAAHCAITSALEGNVQATKDDFEIMLLETRAANAAPTEGPSASAKAAAYKAKAAKNAADAKRLEEKATAAQARAEALSANARSAADNAEKALQGAQ